MASALKRAVKAAFPAVERFRARQRYERELQAGEYELRLLPSLVSSGSLSIDVGANSGAYSWHLSKLGPVVAFEPNPIYARRIEGIKGVRLERTALSDHVGHATLHIPLDSQGQAAGGWATLENRPAVEMASNILVQVHTLDSYGLAPGFLKIDVEGHEEAVLRGALETIRQSRPTILVEVEERHNEGSTSCVPAMLEAEGYHGFFYVSGQRLPISEFDPAVHQPPVDPKAFEGSFVRSAHAYYNNFLFLPAG